MALPDGIDAEVVIGYLIFAILSIIALYYLNSDLYISFARRSKQKEKEKAMKEEKKINQRKEEKIKMKVMKENKKERTPKLYTETKL